jgi:ribose transport system ATP-binding protein
MRGIVKRFGGVAVLNDVDFSVQPGEVVALLGSNGAGKSTLMKILTGVYQRDAGQIAIDGSEATMASTREASALGISFLPQEISVIPDMTVAENICLGDLPMRSRLGVRVVDDARMQARAASILGELGFAHISPRAYAADLTVAERRIVEIARALAADASILVMDEPTASLTEQEAETIFRIVRKLRERQTSVVYISHYLKEVFAIADRIDVLRDGRNAGRFVPGETSVATVVEAMLGTVAGDMFAPRSGVQAPGETLLVAEHLALGKNLRDVSLTVARGEIVGVFGLVGSGVELLGRVIYGAEGARHGGAMRFAGAAHAPRGPADGKRAGIGFVTAERKKDGIIAELTVRENLVAPFQRRFGRGLFTDRARETAQTVAMIRSLGIRTRGPEQQMRTLSGGNQQKVCLARWLDPSVKMLILEEPTRGVDVGARREIYAQLVALSRDGLAILVLSSDVEEIAGLADRALVIDRGMIAAEFAGGTDAATLMHATTLGAAA